MGCRHDSLHPPAGVFLMSRLDIKNEISRNHHDTPSKCILRAWVSILLVEKKSKNFNTGVTGSTTLGDFWLQHHGWIFQFTDNRRHVLSPITRLGHWQEQGGFCNPERKGCPCHQRGIQMRTDSSKLQRVCCAIGEIRRYGACDSGIPM